MFFKLRALAPSLCRVSESHLRKIPLFHPPLAKGDEKGDFLRGLCVPSTLLRTCFAGDIPSFGCGWATLSRY